MESVQPAREFRSDIHLGKQARFYQCLPVRAVCELNELKLGTGETGVTGKTKALVLENRVSGHVCSPLNLSNF